MSGLELEPDCFGITMAGLITAIVFLVSMLESTGSNQGKTLELIHETLKSGVTKGINITEKYCLNLHFIF